MLSKGPNWDSQSGKQEHRQEGLGSWCRRSILGPVIKSIRLSWVDRRVYCRPVGSDVGTHCTTSAVERGEAGLTSHLDLIRDGDRLWKEKKNQQYVLWHRIFHFIPTLLKSRLHVSTCNWYVPIQSPTLAAKKKKSAKSPSLPSARSKHVVHSKVITSDFTEQNATH